MNSQARILLVVLCSVLAAGAVYALSTSPSPAVKSAQMAASVPSSSAVSPSSGSSLAAAPSGSVSLSPDLSHTDAYEFLDPPLVGKPAPNFVANTAEGKRVSLAEFKGRKNVVLVFYQGSFCPVCGQQLTNLQNHLADFRAQDAEIMAISADDATHAQQTVGEHGLSFSVIPDAGKKIIRQYGIANVSRQNIAWPSLFVIDKKGTVQLSFANQEGHRLHSNEILPVLSKITGKPAPALQYEE